MVVKCNECGNTKLNKITDTPEVTHYVCSCGSDVYVQKTKSKPKPTPSKTAPKKEPTKTSKSSKNTKEEKSHYFI